MDTMTKDQRHRNMQSIKSKDTKPEKILCKALWHSGIRYRKNMKALTGTPDIVITKYRIAIFVDGDFWHCKNHQSNPGEQITTNTSYWKRKLARNVERDKEVNDILTDEGWLVLRFWESDIKNNLDNCVKCILSYL